MQGQLERPLPVRPTHQSERVLSERFIASPAQEIFGLRVPVPDNALRVDLDKSIQRSVDDAARELLAFA